MKKLSSLSAFGILAIILLAFSGVNIGYHGAEAFQFYHSPGKTSDTVVVVGANAAGVPATKLPTYHAQVADLTPASAATDVVTITGSATKVIKITRIQVTADASSSSVLDLYTFYRTTPNTGGTSSAVAAISHDPSVDPAASATVLKYTANPTSLGTGGLVAADHYALPAATTTGYPGTPWSEDFGVRNSEPITLRGVNQSFTFSLNGQTLPAGTALYVGIEWTEE